MSLEKEVIEGKFDIIDRNLRFLEEIKTLSPDQFVESYKDVQAAKYSLLEIMEACIDIANYIISVKGSEEPKSIATCSKFLKRRES